MVLYIKILMRKRFYGRFKILTFDSSIMVEICQQRSFTSGWSLILHALNFSVPQLLLQTELTAVATQPVGYLLATF